MSGRKIIAGLNEALDLLWGCTAIAEAIGRTRRATFHMLEKRQLPAKRVGGRWVASRAALAEFFEVDNQQD